MSRRREPEKPISSDCCGSGCTPCVFDIYEKQLLSWQESSIGDVDYSLRNDLLSETCYKPFILIEKQNLTENVVHFRFQALESETSNNKKVEIRGILPYKVGQHIFLRCTVGDCKEKQQFQDPKNSKNVESLGNNKSIVRAYTPITLSAKEENCCFNVFVKLYEDGKASNYFKQSVIGDIMYWRGPQGEFKYQPNSYSYILMLCMGTGLAPMISVIKTILNNEADETSIHLMFGVQNINNIILRNKLREMAHFWNFTVEYYFSQLIDQHTDLKFGELGKKQRINLHSIKDYFTGKDLKKLKVLICGSESFSLAMKNNLQILGINVDSNVHIF